MARAPRSFVLIVLCSCLALGLVAPARPGAAAEPGLLAHWTFEGNSTADSSGFDHTLTLHGVTDFVTGVRGSALLLGSGASWADRASVPLLSPGSRSWSVALWARPSATSPFTRMLLSWYRCGADPNCAHEDAALYWLGLQPNGRPFWFVRGDGSDGATVEGPDSLVLGQWRHLAGTYDATAQMLRMYVDGQLVDSAESPIGAIAGGPASVPISLGRLHRVGWGQPGEYFVGALDDVRIYERELSAAEVLTLSGGGTAAVGSAITPRVELSPAAPNPFGRDTRIAFRLSTPADVRLSVHDVAGREVARLVAGERAAGEHSVRWSGVDDRGRDVRAGVYFVRLVSNSRDGRPAERRTTRVLRVH